LRVTVRVEFKPKERLLRAGRLTITTSNFHVETKDLPVEVPSVFAALLLDEAVKSEAYKLLDATLQFNDSARGWLLTSATKEGFKHAWSLLRDLEAKKPQGPTIYRQTEPYSFEPNKPYIVITDGKECVCFRVNENLYEKRLSHFPLNAYVVPEWASLYDLTDQEFLQAERCLNDFFSFTVRLRKLGTVTSRRKESIIKAFFRNQVEAYKMLRDAERDDKRRKERDELWDSLRNKAIKIRGGYLTRTWYGLAYITTDGQIFTFEARDETVTKELAYRACKHNKIPPNLKLKQNPELFKDEFKELVAKIGKHDPALALILTP
jgi:hypothetical protein